MAASKEGAFNANALSRDFFSATIGSILCSYTGQPLDTVKVRMQTSPELYHTVWQSTMKTITDEGVNALWKGSVPTVMGMIAENCIAFGLNEALKRTFPLPQHHHQDSTYQSSNATPPPPDFVRPFIFGTFTGVCSSFALLPSEVVKAKTQVATDVGHASSSSYIYNKMIKTQGYKSLMCGFDAQIVRDGAFYGVFFGGYELFCYSFKTLVPSIPDELNYFLSGGFAGMLGWTIAMPLDVPKTNVQARWDTRVFGSYFPEVIRIYKHQGIVGFYNGLGPTLLRAFPANAALFCGVEMGKKFWDERIMNGHSQ
jgi:solute carrier family 25 (mitochondrial ornithine transporter) member 2/15